MPGIGACSTHLDNGSHEYVKSQGLIVGCVRKGINQSWIAHLRDSGIEISGITSKWEAKSVVYKNEAAAHQTYSDSMSDEDYLRIRLRADRENDARDRDHRVS